MPASEDGSLPFLIDLLKVLVALSLPAKGLPDQPDEPGTDL